MEGVLLGCSPRPPEPKKKNNWRYDDM